MRSGWRIAAMVASGVALTIAAGHAQQAPAAEEPVAPVIAAKAEVPRVFYTHPQRFEIVVSKADDAQQALALGRSVWAALSGPLRLPSDGFSSPISVRLIPADQWKEEAVFTAVAEAPGRVLVRIRWSNEVDPMVVRRAFVQGLLLRQGITWHGASASLTVPLWLEQGATAWSLISERPAMLDSFQQESAAVTLPPLRSLLQWERGAVDSRGWELASLWLFLQLQAEPGDGARWTNWLRSLLGGASAMDSLPRAYPRLWSDAAAQELWWRTVCQHQSRQYARPLMTAESSRIWMADRSRWLAGREGREIVLPLGELISLRKEKWLKTELTERVTQTRAVLGVIHPFYANAAISMGRLYEAAANGDQKQFDQSMKAFESDAIAGRELEDTVNAVLDTAPRR